MLTTHFFADRDFLELLQFWDASRGGRPVPDWSGDIAVIPPGILPNLIISDRRGAPTYHYVGDACIRRWGSDPTGKRAYGDVLRGAHARYLQSLSAECLARRAPVFSTAVYEPSAADLLMTGRLHAPFTYRGSAEPCFLLTVQLFKGSERELSEIGIAGIVHEIRRDLITDPSTLCSRLEEARRQYQIARHTHRRTLAEQVEAITQELAGRALVTLPCFEEPDPVVGG